MPRRLLILWCSVIGLGGCSVWNPPFWNLSSVNHETTDEVKKEPSTKTVGDWAVPFGLYPIRVENVGLVTNLAGTGSDPAPSPYRQALVTEMQARGVESPNSVLGSKNTSLVLVQAHLRPGIQKGDHIDVEVRIPSHSETTSLAGGFLLETRLTEMAVLDDNRAHSGKMLAKAEGAILVEPESKGDKNNVSRGRGRVPGGAVALESRPLGLILKPPHRSAPNAARIAAAVNKRFYTLQKGLQIGVAKARTDQLVELSVHPRYKNNIERYVQVARAVALRESSAEQVARIEQLKADLLDPKLSADAARQLEAIGRDGIAALKGALKASNTEVRFYAAEALAYLDQREAAAPLGEIAGKEPAFRVFALAALSAMEDPAATEQLCNLLNVASAETRYGAFRALWSMGSQDPIVRDDPGVKDFSYHVLDTKGPPMIHVTRYRRPELVLFGKEQRFRAPLVVNAGTRILVRSTDKGEISVSRFAVGQPDQKRLVSSRVDDVVRAIVDLGGTFPDVVRAIEEAKAADGLEGRFAVDALPEAGRAYASSDNDEGEALAKAETRIRAKDRGPDIFAKQDGPPKGDKKSKSSDSDKEEDAKKKSASSSASSKGFLARITGWGSDD